MSVAQAIEPAEGSMISHAELESSARQRFSTQLFPIPPVKLRAGEAVLALAIAAGTMATVSSESISSCQVLALRLSLLNLTLLSAVFFTLLPLVVAV